MDNKPYFCPNCRSNRVKFSVITRYSQYFMKDAISGEIVDTAETMPLHPDEPEIQCLVCNFAGNEQRFVKQAEREPRMATPTESTY
ncbi:hypothetical protein [Paenibacillus sp. J2TS4]|uniref:hypothetical protein n=1 Tax=Paenibacillus sp. J2TS4 TaxID=2807194 RepID=UPI001B1CF380|nr:hypothetical protein [Paenibacillus sp. J2TS4]GIP33051.1 hypothetical protein J2TS4_22610 [Paenibacillus sp. J2TS4]